MKKRLFLLMLMLLTGTQTVLHCADAGDDQARDELNLRLKLDGDQIQLNELPEMPKREDAHGISLRFVGGACGLGAALSGAPCLSTYLLKSDIYVHCGLELLKCIKNYDAKELAKLFAMTHCWLVFIGIPIASAVFGTYVGSKLDDARFEVKLHARDALRVLRIIHNQAALIDGLAYSLRTEDNDRMLKVVDNNNDRNRLLRRELFDLRPGHDINIDELMRGASVSGLFNRLLVGRDNLRRANAVMAKIKPLDEKLNDELHKQVALQARNVKPAGKPGKR